MSQSLENLKVRMDVEAAGFHRAVKDVEAKVVGLEGKFDGLRRAIDVAFSAGIAGAVVGLAVKLAQFAKHAIDAADAMGKLAQQVGTSVEDMSRLAYAAELSDISSEELAGSLRHLSKAAAEAASGSAEQADTFARLGVSVRDANGEIKPSTVLFRELAQRFSELDPSVEKTDAALKIFGKTGDKLFPLFKDGAAGLAELARESDRFGATISGEQAEAAERFNDSLTKVKLTVEGLGRALAQADLDRFNQVADGWAALDRAFGTQTTHGVRGAPAQGGGPKLAPKGLLTGWFDEEKGGKSRSGATDDHLDPLREMQRFEESQARVLARAAADAARLGDLMDRARESSEVGTTAIEREIAALERRRRSIARAEAAANEDALARDVEGKMQAAYERQRAAYERHVAEMRAIAQQAAEGMAGIFTDHFFNGFREGLQGLLRDWFQFLARMAVQRASARLIDAGINAAIGYFSGGAGGAIAGGVVGGASAISVPSHAFTPTAAPVTARTAAPGRVAHDVTHHFDLAEPVVRDMVQRIISDEWATR